MVSALTRYTAQQLSGRAQAGWRWRGRSVKLVDGTGILMPDTAANKKILVTTLLSRRSVSKTALGELFRKRWHVGVSREGHVFKSVKVRPRPRDSGLVAWEAPLRESKTVEPSDNMLSKGVCAKHPVVSRMNADVASLHAFPVAEMVDNKRKQQVLYRNESDATALTGRVSAATGCE